MIEGQRCVVVTGASSGIGLGTVRVLVQQGFHVCGSVRKSEDAERLQAEFGAAVTPLLFDVLDEAAVQKAAEQVQLFNVDAAIVHINLPNALHSPLQGSVGRTLRAARWSDLRFAG